MTEWTPGRRELTLMQGLSVVAVVAGGLLYGAVWGLAHPEGFLFTAPVVLLGLFGSMLGLVAVVVVHEVVHGLAMLPHGARPRFGFTRLAGVVPAFYCTADGHRFTQPQFAWIALAPTLVVSALLGVVAAMPWIGPGVVAVAALHLSGCAGDWVMLAVAARQPRGTLVEDLATGMRFHPPAAPAASGLDAGWRRRRPRGQTGPDL